MARGSQSEAGGLCGSMHRSALRGGPAEGWIQPGWLLAGGGIIAVLGLRPTPGLFPGLSLLLTGIAAILAPHLQRRGHGRISPAAVMYGAIAGPLVMGLPAALTAEPPIMRAVWFAVFAAAGAILGRHTGELLCRVEHLDRVRTLPPSELGVYATEVLSGRGSEEARSAVVLEAAERLLEQGDTPGAGDLLDRIPVRATPHSRREGLRLRSALSLMDGDLEFARELAQGLLAEPLDLEEARQFRAWGAYVELAAGCPRTAAELAAAAVGPHAMAGASWVEHCGALQAWALTEQGYPEDARELVRFLLANLRPGSHGTPSLHAVTARIEFQLGEWERAGQALRLALEQKDLDEPDPFVLGVQCIVSGAAGEAAALVEAAERALAVTCGSFARALAHADAGWGWLNLREGKPAEEQFRKALDLWPTLPSACEGLADALALQGSREEAERVRSEGARRYPQHRIAIRRQEADG